MRFRAASFAFLTGCAICAQCAFATSTDTLSANALEASAFNQPTNLASLLEVPAEDLDKVDAGLINILCAEGLPGAEQLDVKKCLDELDSWASRVKSETDRQFHLFVEHPERFCNSLAYYRMQMLGDVLVNELRMRYDPIRIEPSIKGLKSPNAEIEFFQNPKDIFLFGLLDGDRYGTCASMPFLYVAVGRRLGYPVNLVATQEHLYVRCEDTGGQHLNVEATAVSRFKTPPDEYYRDMVTATNRDDEISQVGWLRPLSNREIVGHSLLSRLFCLRSAGRYDEELKTWGIAAKYLPGTSRWRETIKARESEMRDERRVAQWTTRWRQIQQTPIPPGPGYVYFRDQKIGLHMLMMDGTDLATVQKAVDAFNKDLGQHLKSTIEKDASSGSALQPSNPPGSNYVSHFKFQDSGSEVAVPDDLMPPMMRSGLPPEIVDAILDRKLESENAILDFLWERYEKGSLTKDSLLRAEMDRMVENGPQPILIAQESVPEEYWNGLPQDLALVIEGEKDPQQIIGDIRAYYLSQAAQKRTPQATTGVPTPAFSPGTFHAPLATSDYLERQRRIQENTEAEAYERQHPKIPLSQTRIRFVPTSSMQGRQFTATPGYPMSLPTGSTQPAIQPPIEGNP